MCGPGFDYRQRQEIILLPKSPDRLWRLTSLTFSGFRGALPGVSWPRHDADRSLPPRAQVKSYTSTPPIWLYWVDRENFRFFWAPSQICEKRLLVLSCLSVRVKQLGSHWTDFHETWYLSIFRKSVQKIQVSLKSDKNNGHCTWGSIYVFYLISIISP